MNINQSVIGVASDSYATEISTDVKGFHSQYNSYKRNYTVDTYWWLIEKTLFVSGFYRV